MYIVVGDDIQVLFQLWWELTELNSVKSSADLVTFTEEILNGKLCFLCSENALYSTVC